MDCPNCNKEDPKVELGVDGRYRHAGEKGACGLVIEKDFVEEHKDDLNIVTNPQGSGGEGGPMKITGLEDSYSSRLKKKFQTIRRWIQGEPVGVDPTSKGSSYLLKRVKETPKVMDDYRRLIKWIDQSTGAKEMSVEEVMSDLMEIDQEQEKGKIIPGFGPGLEEEEGSEAEEELTEVKKRRNKIREEIEDEALDRLKDRRPAEKIGNALEDAGFYKHLGTILTNKVAHPGKSLAEGLLELGPSDRRELIKDYIIAQSEISKSGSVEGPEPEEEGGADSLIGESDLEEPVEEMSDEKLKKFSEKSEQLSPDLKASVALEETERERAKKESEEETRGPIGAREARKEAEKEMDRGKTEKKGEEELHDHIPEDL